MRLKRCKTNSEVFQSFRVLKMMCLKSLTFQGPWCSCLSVGWPCREVCAARAALCSWHCAEPGPQNSTAGQGDSKGTDRPPAGHSCQITCRAANTAMSSGQVCFTLSRDQPDVWSIQLLY